MARNKSERFPYSEAVRKYLIIWHPWDAADRPEDCELRRQQAHAYEALSHSDQGLLRVRLRAPSRRVLITQFNLDGT